MKRINTDTRPLYEFYTYNPVGRDVIIPIRGIDEDDAYNTFKELYRDINGSVPLIDQIIKVY
jgi:hypothetical protein